MLNVHVIQLMKKLCVLNLSPATIAYVCYANLSRHVQTCDIYLTPYKITCFLSIIFFFFCKCGLKNFKNQKSGHVI